MIILNKRSFSSRMPYGPYIAAASVLYVFGGYKWLRHLFF